MDDPVKLLAALNACFDALEMAEEYFDNRSDADCDQDGFIPNEEMKLLSEVSEAMNKAMPFIARVKHLTGA